MSAPQPPTDRPSDGDARPDAAAPTAGTGDGGATYDFHGEKLDFDPYRFGAPEPATTAWPTTPPAAPGSDGGRPPAPGERWQPGQDAGTPPVQPGDYWAGAGSHRGTFPPAGYVPPTDPADPTASARSGDGASRVDLGKPADPAGPAGPPAYPAGASYPPRRADPRRAPTPARPPRPPVAATGSPWPVSSSGSSPACSP